MFHSCSCSEKLTVPNSSSLSDCLRPEVRYCCCCCFYYRGVPLQLKHSLRSSFCAVVVYLPYYSPYQQRHSLNAVSFTCYGLQIFSIESSIAGTSQPTLVEFLEIPSDNCSQPLLLLLDIYSNIINIQNDMHNPSGIINYPYEVISTHSPQRTTHPRRS